ncbi:DUF3267 domain-containing protein [Halomarina pelagica]|uniref:DUF3267 domain-containing protein n=1 Tax=Halomarina pelagica TaxID=2961599 RepID=UPI0020C39824|nr:DUF3267 domain-containing protein [Halomarina sp. BND7]
MVGIETAAVGAISIVGAAVAHELTHVAAAYPFAKRVGVDWWRLDVYTTLEPDTSKWVDRFVGLSPLFVGLFGGLIALAVGATPPLELDTALLFIAWSVYTIGGDFSDYKPTYVTPDDTVDDEPAINRTPLYKLWAGLLAIPVGYVFGGIAGTIVLVVGMGTVALTLVTDEPPLADTHIHE